MKLRHLLPLFIAIFAVGCAGEPPKVVETPKDGGAAPEAKADSASGNSMGAAASAGTE